jgi:hypothetical protein
MAVNFKELTRQFDLRLEQTVLASSKPTTFIQYPNLSYGNTTLATPFIKATLKTGIVQSATLGRDGKNEVYGVYFVNLFSALNTHINSNLDFAQEILDGFPKGEKLSFGNNDIILRVGSIDTGLEAEGFYLTPISIPFTAYMEV